MIKRISFIVWFAAGLFPFIAINLLGYISAAGCCDGDSYTDVGFPITWYTSGGFVAPSHIIWSGFVADALIAVGTGFVSAKILTSVIKSSKSEAGTLPMRLRRKS
jgi:hypothetical protein